MTGVHFDHLGGDLELDKLAAQALSGFGGRGHGPGLEALAHRTQRADDLLMPRVNPALREVEVGDGQPAAVGRR
jgi:hypothetical protein